MRSQRRCSWWLLRSYRTIGALEWRQLWVDYARTLQQRLVGRLNGLGLKMPKVVDLRIATMLKAWPEVRGVRVEV